MTATTATLIPADETINLQDPQVVLQLAPLLAALKAHESYPALLALRDRLIRNVEERCVRAPKESHDQYSGQVIGLEMLFKAVEIVLNAATVIQTEQLERARANRSASGDEVAPKRPNPLEGALWGGSLGTD